MSNFQKKPKVKGEYKERLEKEIIKDFLNYGEYKRLVIPKKVAKVGVDICKDKG